MADKQKIKNIIAQIKNEQVKGEQPPQTEDELSSQSDLTPDQVNALIKDQELEEKYGDSSLRTFAESTASSASFGLSDQALVKSGLVSQEELRERRIRNKEATVLGEVAGVVGPALLSSGTSLLAKGTAAGIKGAAKAGLVTERLTANALKKVLAETGKKKLAKEVLRKSITKGAGSAVEGSFYGAGKLISEEALGLAEFNAENLISDVSAGAILGGIAGGAFGTVEALVPVFKGGKVKDFAHKKLKTQIDPELNAQKLAGLSPSEIVKQKELRPDIVAHTPEMLKEIMTSKGVKSYHSNESLFKASKQFLDETGEAIGKTLDDIEQVLKPLDQLPMKSQLATKIANRLDDLAAKFKDADGNILKGAKPKVAKIQRVISEFDDDLLSDKIMSAKELNDLKSKYQKLAKWDRRGQLPLEEEISREISRAIRSEVMELAELAGDEVGSKLKKQMLDYGAASEFIGNFAKKIDKQSNKEYLTLRDMMLGAATDVFASSGVAVGAIATKKFLQSDFKRKLTILSGIEKANQKVTKKVNSSVDSFFSKRPISVPTATNVLLRSALARDEKGTIPSDKQEAFKNIQKNVTDMTNPDNADKYLNRGNISVAAPQTDSVVKVRLHSAIAFLDAVMPRESASNSVFAHMRRKWNPSTQQLSKFERYLKAVEQPLSVLEDLESGKINREGVEAIKNVYPNLYQRIQEKVMERISQDPESLTYQKRLQLGILLDIPTDTALVPENIQALQAYFKEAQVSQAGDGRITPTKAENLDIAQSTMTETQKVQSRE